MIEALRFPVVAMGFVVNRLGRLLGARTLGAHRTLIVGLLLVSAAVAFVVWGLERAPQRFSLAQLAAGELSPMQSWIIISGDLRAEASRPSRYLYRLTDPAAPNASMIVVANFELPLGWQTVSGQYIGTREGVPPGFNWVGYMQAEPVPAQEQPPPWIAMILAGAGLALGIAGRLSYPVFFPGTPMESRLRTARLEVGVRRAQPRAGEGVERGTLRLSSAAPVMLRAEGEDESPLRLHSAYTSAEVGELQSVSGSEPALRVHQPSGDVVLTFASREDRDATFAALIADSPTHARVRA